MNFNGDQVDVFADTPALALAAAQRFVWLATNAVEDHGVFAVALSGGSTPKVIKRWMLDAAGAAGMGTIPG